MKGSERSELETLDVGSALHFRRLLDRFGVSFRVRCAFLCSQEILLAMLDSDRHRNTKNLLSWLQVDDALSHSLSR
jgi:hypothetical protein